MQWKPYSSDSIYMFEEENCAGCARDKICNGEVKDWDDAKDGDLCEILAAAHRGRGEAIEWQRDEKGTPYCTRFTPMDAPSGVWRDDLTKDMFEVKHGT